MHFRSWGITTAAACACALSLVISKIKDRAKDSRYLSIKEKMLNQPQYRSLSSARNNPSFYKVESQKIKSCLTNLFSWITVKLQEASEFTAKTENEGVAQITQAGLCEQGFAQGELQAQTSPQDTTAGAWDSLETSVSFITKGSCSRRTMIPRGLLPAAASTQSFTSSSPLICHHLWNLKMWFWCRLSWGEIVSNT